MTKNKGGRPTVMTDVYKNKLIILAEELEKLYVTPRFIGSPEDKENMDREINMKTYYLLGYILALKNYEK